MWAQGSIVQITELKERTDALSRIIDVAEVNFLLVFISRNFEKYSRKKLKNII
jgi:hypothetical protein